MVSDIRNSRERKHLHFSDFFKLKFLIFINPGRNISQNFSEIIFDFLIFQFSEKFWEIFQISSASSRLSPKITEWEI